MLQGDLSDTRLAAAVRKRDGRGALKNRLVGRRMTQVGTGSIDVLLLAPDWRSRVLLRAQLIEVGVQVCATDSWSSAREMLLTTEMNGIVVVDLLDLATPRDVLRELSALVSPARVVIIGAAATVPADALRGVASAILCRPLRVGHVVNAIARVLSPLHRSPRVPRTVDAAMSRSGTPAGFGARRIGRCHTTRR